MKRLSTCRFRNPESRKRPQFCVVNFAMLVCITLLLSLSACNTGSKQNDEAQSESQEQREEDSRPTAKAKMEPASGSNVRGEVTFTEQNGKVRMELSVENLTAGEHAVHLHEHGDCSADDASSAGGHWNPTMKPHGKRGDGTAYHKGDIDNMRVGDDGKGTLNITVDGWSIGGPDSTNIVGKSVIIHEKADDFTSQPSGNAGSRVSCGVIETE